MNRRSKTSLLEFDDHGDLDEFFHSSAPHQLGRFWAQRPGRSPIHPIIVSAAPNSSAARGLTQSDAEAASEASEPSEIAENNWIELELVDMHDEPVANARYELQPGSGGPMKTGRLNAQGVARIEGLPPGPCQVCFPDYDAEAWQRA